MGIQDRSSLVDLPRDTLIDSWGCWVPKNGEVAVAEGALVIPVTHAVVNKTSGVGAEALTLANGKPGQILKIHLGTAGGGANTLTPATATGWATVIFLGAKDQVTLLYVDDTIGWIILGASGTDAPPVIS